MKSRLRVSLVIPAYNEAAHIKQCLEAIERQSTAPFEVLLVDNNSTDDTVKIAQSFPFVKVLHEKRQGVLYARATGFSAARGDIIGRIDADTILPSEWIATVETIMLTKRVDAFSGSMDFYDLGLRSVVNTLETANRKLLCQYLEKKGTVLMQGSNMALRRSSWEKVASDLCLRDDIHEDIDLALHMQMHGMKVTFEKALNAQVSARRLDAPVSASVAYAQLIPNTYAIHNSRGHKVMVLMSLLLIGVYFPLRVIYRGYNTATEEFTLPRVFRSSGGRVNPFAARD